MIGVDTNVLVRFLVGDDERQSLAASRAFAAASRRGIPIFVSQIVLCELVWVLSRAYRRSRNDIAAVLELLLKSAELAIELRDEVSRAVRAFRSGGGDFADYLIREKARSAGCETVITFDSALLREESFEKPERVSG